MESAQSIPHTEVSRGQMWLGAITLCMVPACMWILVKVTDPIARLQKVFLDFPLQPGVSLAILVGKAIDRTWYLWLAILFVVYFLWIVRHSARVLWFNAILAVIVTVLLCSSTISCMRQQAAIHRELRKR